MTACPLKGGVVSYNNSPLGPSVGLGRLDSIP